MRPLSNTYISLYEIGQVALCEEAEGKRTADFDSREGFGEVAPEWENLDGVTQ